MIPHFFARKTAMKTLITVLMIATLAACSPLTIPGESISVPVPEKADAPPKTAFSGAVRVGKVTTDALVYGALEQRKLTVEKPEMPLATALASAGYLAKDDASARYVLNAEIIEVVNAVCMFGDCITHATVAYTLTPVGGKEPIWQRRLKTPFHYKHSTFSLMDDATHRAIIGGAIGHNYQEAVAQLTQVKAPKKAAETKPVSPQKTP